MTNNELALMTENIVYETRGEKRKRNPFSSVRTGPRWKVPCRNG